jgi:plastocyanin
MAGWQCLYRAGTISAVCLLMAACGGAGPVASTPGGVPVTVPVVSTQGNRFNPAVLEVTAGQTARFQFTDVAEPHTFTVSTWNVNALITSRDGAVEFMVPVDARGDTPFFCSVHAGMTGTLKIKP